MQKVFSVLEKFEIYSELLIGNGQSKGQLNVWMNFCRVLE